MKNDTMELFPTDGGPESRGQAPLAERMRPGTLEEFVGQDHILGEGKLLRQLIEFDQVTSLILWGPPGSGKTTLARIIANHTKSHFIFFSAILSGVKDIREVIKEAEEERKYHGRKTILFIDEIHRFNKAQQDAFLPYVEKGVVTIIGATTENPSFEVIAPLLSRCKVLVLNPLKDDEIVNILATALSDGERGLGKLSLSHEAEALSFIAEQAGGDARIALNTLETAAKLAKNGVIDLGAAREAVQRKPLLYDKGGEEHYNVISAFIKSMRGSDPDGALYWLARMLEAGEDPTAQEPLRSEGGGEIGLEDLEGDLATVLQVVGEIDGGHAALAELALEMVAVGQRGLETLEVVHRAPCDGSSGCKVARSCGVVQRTARRCNGDS